MVAVQKGLEKDKQAPNLFAEAISVLYALYLFANMIIGVVFVVNIFVSFFRIPTWFWRVDMALGGLFLIFLYKENQRYHEEEVVQAVAYERRWVYKTVAEDIFDATSNNTSDIGDDNEHQDLLNSMNGDELENYVYGQIVKLVNNQRSAAVKTDEVLK